MAFGVAHCQAGDRHRLASPGIPPLLEMEESALRWSPVFISGSSQSDPSNEPRQPALGSAAYSWGIAEDWNRCVSSNRRQIHGPTPETSLPEVANLSQESRQVPGLGRLLRGAHHHFSTLVRLCDSWPRSPTSDSFRCDR